MPLVPAICPRCGASIKVDNSTDAEICEYCGTAFVTEKAINHYNVTNAINVNSSGNVINIIYNNSADNSNIIQDTEIISPYTITISRRKRFYGSAIIFIFSVDGTTYDLTNGGQISFSTKMKHLNIDVAQIAPLGAETVHGHLVGEADGKDINILLTVGNVFDKFAVDILASTNKTIKIQ